MKLRAIFIGSMIAFASINTLADTDNSSRLAVQGAIATGGNISIGLVTYREKTELGFTIAGKINNSSNQTKIITPVIFAGLRKAMKENTYFAYGIDFASAFGKESGETINSNYQVGPYISLEQMLTHNFMLSGWIQPYQYEYKKVGGSSTSTNNFFSTGGLAINYLFS
jgi:hypothetical protein